MMQGSRTRLASLALACVAGAAHGPLSAASINVSPVVVEVGSPRKAVAVTITNNSNRAVTFQADALTWRQDNGVDRYEPTGDLLVVPSVLEIPPNGGQVIRVVLRKPAPSPVERTYRLILEDITTDVAPPEGKGLAFRFTHNLPVMIAPSAKVQNSMQWKPCAAPAPAKQLCVSLRNSGNRRIKVASIKLGGDAWQQTLPLKEQLNVLAGAYREWRLPPAAGNAGPVRTVTVLTAQGETLQASRGEF
jgi:fimbrial chaperone protein